MSREKHAPRPPLPSTPAIDKFPSAPPLKPPPAPVFPDLAEERKAVYEPTPSVWSSTAVIPRPAPTPLPSGTRFSAVGIVALPGPVFKLVELALSLEPDGSVVIMEPPTIGKDTDRRHATAYFKQAAVHRGIVR